MTMITNSSSVPPDSQATCELQALNPALHAIVSTTVQAEDKPAHDRFEASLDPQISNEALRWVMGRPPTNQKACDAWMRLIQEYPGPVPIRSLRDTIFDNLLAVGICPGGSGFTEKRYKAQEGGSSRVDLQACKLGTGRRFTTS
jgi:hypothetical protein